MSATRFPTRPEPGGVWGPCWGPSRTRVAEEHPGSAGERREFGGRGGPCQGLSRNQMTASGWERFATEADVGVRGWGTTRGEAFAQVTLGLFALLVAPDEVRVTEHREVRAQADVPERLLAAWVDECLYVHEIEGFVARSVEMTVCTDTLAHGVLHGEPLDPERHRLGARGRGTVSQGVKVGILDGGHQVR